jgi:hypothetical protein
MAEEKDTRRAGRCPRPLRSSVIVAGTRGQKAVQADNFAESPQAGIRTVRYDSPNGAWVWEMASAGRRWQDRAGPMTGNKLSVPRLWAAATTSSVDHGGRGAEFRQRRPLETGAPGAVIECIIGYRV